MQPKNIKETGNQSKIRSINRDAILNYLRQHQTASRIEIVKQLKLAPATVTAVVAELINDKLLIEVAVDSDSTKRSRGRPSREIRLNPNAAYTLGISLRVEHNVLFMDTAWSDYCHHVQIASSFTCNDKENFDSICACFLEAIDSLMDSLPDKANVIGLGIGIPGVVNEQTIQLAPNVPALEGDKLYQALRKTVPFEVYFENDVNLLIIEELEKRPELRSKNASYLFISQGLGASTALYGELWRASGWAGEIGHIAIPTSDQELKTLEWLISLDGYLAQALAAHDYDLNDDSPFPAELSKPEITSIFATYTHYLFLAIQMLNASFGLDVIIIGTSYPNVLKAFMKPLEALIQQSPLKVSLVFTAMAQNAAVRGATLLALKHSLILLHDREQTQPA